jgi:hypothetical protein
MTAGIAAIPDIPFFYETSVKVKVKLKVKLKVKVKQSH